VTDEIVLRYPDAEGLVAVRLVAELWKRDPPRPFARANGGWELRLRAPEADRLEFLLGLEHADGSSDLVTAPGAPTVPGPFGVRSVVELPAYRAPAWTRARPPAGALEPLSLPGRTLRATASGLLWSPPGTSPREPLPLLVVHDGPEYVAYSSLAHYLDGATAERRIPRLRAALLAPVDRDEHYSASARYARALHDDLLPALLDQAPAPPGRRFRAGMGASLGALAVFHAHRLRPDTFGSLFLQSGSFFRRPHDRVEAGFPRFERIARFVRAASREGEPSGIPVAMTCGLAEENLGSNRAFAAALRAQGYEVTLAETRDAHNWISWRDAFDPHLTDLLCRAFG
jgi:enterochelin esterase family protein